jgi:hypothetical protein
MTWSVSSPASTPRSKAELSLPQLWWQPSVHTLSQVRGGLPSEMETSARLTLNFPMTFKCLCDELPMFEGWALRDLVGFRKRCRNNLISCFQSFLNYDYGHPSFDIWISCTDTTNINPYSCPLYTGRTCFKPPWLHQLFQAHLTELGQGFANPLFNPPTIRGKYLSALQAHLNGYNCLSCTRVHTLKGEAFCEELENGLTLALSKVSTSFIFQTNLTSLNIYLD